MRVAQKCRGRRTDRDCRPRGRWRALASRSSQVAAATRANPPRDQANVLKCKSIGTSLRERPSPFGPDERMMERPDHQSLGQDAMDHRSAAPDDPGLASAASCQFMPIFLDQPPSFRPSECRDGEAQPFQHQVHRHVGEALVEARPSARNQVWVQLIMPKNSMVSGSASGPVSGRISAISSSTVAMIRRCLPITSERCRAGEIVELVEEHLVAVLRADIEAHEGEGQRAQLLLGGAAAGSRPARRRRARRDAPP